MSSNGQYINTDNTEIYKSKAMEHSNNTSNNPVEKITREHSQNLQYVVSHPDDKNARQRYRQSLKRLLESRE